MYARVTELVGLSGADADRHVQHFEDEILPKAEGTPGMNGGLVLMDRDTGRALVITLWEDEDTLTDSREEMSALRELAFQRLNLTTPAIVREYEVGVARLERAVDPIRT